MHRRHAINYFAVAIALFVLAHVTSSFAQPAPTLAIKYHERIPHLNLTPPETARTPGGAAPQESQQISITAFGKIFQLELQPNEQLIANLPSAQQDRLRKKIQLFRGQLSGVKNSWVRLSQNGMRVSGMIWDGSEIFILDQSDEIASAMSTPNTEAYPLMYRLKDISWPNAQCALDPKAKPIHDYGALVQELNTLAQALPATARELPLAIVADAQFVQSNRLDPEAAVVARMNVVDGIYTSQVGVHLRIAQIRALQANGNLTATSSSALLDQFGVFATTPGFTNPGLAHLFTGRDLDGNIIGVAYVASLCSARFGIGLSQTTGTGTAGALIVAHEIGHNFGAPHDNQTGSSCATTPNGFIMNPSSNGSSTFSTCSLQQMQPNVDQAACISTVIATTADLRPVLPVNPINSVINTNFVYRVEVRNGGSVAATGSTATVSIPNGLQLISSSVTQGSCANAMTQVTCNLGSIAAATAPTITLTLRGASAGRFTSNIAVAAANDSNATNNSVQTTIDIGGSTGAATIFESRFDTGPDGFVYVDDAFRATRQPAYASGTRLPTGGFSGGGLNVVLGGINDEDILNMSGGWRRSFNLTTSRRVSASLRIKLNQSPHFESDEFSQALLGIDGRLVSQVAGRDYLARVAGNGEGGSAITSGWMQVTVDLGVLSAGNHSLTIGGFNNKKTYNNERTDIFIDDVSVTAQ
jgi:uncharacterized repeat protein (TIGR01451 family)